MKKLPAFCMIMSLFGLVFCHNGQEVVGELDLTFNLPAGYVLFNGPSKAGAVAVETAIQEDGKIVVAGYTTVDSQLQILILRYHADGTPDRSFGSGGYVVHGGGLEPKGLGLALGQDGMIFVTGYLKDEGQRDIVVLRCTSKGVVDRLFSYNSGENHTDIGFGIDVQNDGKLVVVGEQSNGVNQDVILLRLTTDLGLDSSFGDGGMVTYNGTGNDKDSGFGVAVQSDGKIVAVGGQTAAGRTNEDVLVLRYLPDGTLDADFADGGVFSYTDVGDFSDHGNFVKLQPDGKIVVVGSSANGDQTKIVVLRLDTDGTLDDTFGTGGVVTYQGDEYPHYSAFGLVTAASGKVVVAGVATDGSKGNAIVLRYSNGGVLDEGFAENGVFTFRAAAGNSSGANGIAAQADGRLVVTGYSYNDSDHEALTFRLR